MSGLFAYIMTRPRLARGNFARVAVARWSDLAGKLHGYEPPADTLERATPVLLLSGEGLSHTCWEATAKYLAHHGFACAVTSFGDLQVAPEGTLTVDGVVKRLHATIRTMMPPIMVAHGVMGLVAQKYLESYAVAGLMLINSLPPDPANGASRLLDLMAAATLSGKHNGDAEFAAAIQQLVITSDISQADAEPVPMKLLHDLQSDPQSKVLLEPEVVPMKFVHTSADAITLSSEVRQMANYHGYSEEEIIVLPGAQSRAPMLERTSSQTHTELQNVILDFVDEF